MKNRYTPKITKEKKTPQLPKWMFVMLWIMTCAVLIFDIYRYAFSNSGISANDIFWDIALVVVAIYMTVFYMRKKRTK